MGVRPLLETRKTWNEEKQMDIIHVRQGPYEWQTYNQVASRVRDFGAGLMKLGERAGSSIVIYAETCPQWMMCAQACFARAVTLATCYANLGADALAHALNETEARLLVVSADLMKNVGVALASQHSLATIVVIGSLGEVDKKKFGKIAVHTFEDVESLGVRHPSEPVGATPDDLAVIMYTSGSTDLPKGVEITHAAMCGALAGFLPALIGLTERDVYIGYLPLAHILELIAETTLLSSGASIGYGSPMTLTDNSPKTMPGTPGDLSALRPTVMAAVPLVLDRVKDAVEAKIAKSAIGRLLFQPALAAAVRAFRNGWSTPFWNLLLFNKIRLAMGGRVRLMVSGGAPLSAATQIWFSAVFCPLGQGYGLTETNGAGTITHPEDVETGVVGAPLACCNIKLRDWSQYQNADVDNPAIGVPRGEILISGSNLSRGYFRLPDKTAEAYFTDETGATWFATGDVGQFQPNGVLKIIDRKKDLVKGLHGEYVSLGKVEGCLRNCRVVDNIMVCQEPSLNNAFAVVSATPEKLAAALGEPVTGDEVRAQSPRLIALMLAELKATGKTEKLKTFEIPTSVFLVPEVWTPDTGIVTAAMKLKRAECTKAYAKQIDELYKNKK